MRQQNFGIPWLLIGDMVVNAAAAGWDYYKTQKQIQSQIGPISPKDISNAAENIAKQSGPNLKVSRQDLERYLYGLVYGTGGTQQPPSALFQQQPPQREGALHTWEWIAFGVVGFIVLKPMLMKGE